MAQADRKRIPALFVYSTLTTDNLGRFVASPRPPLTLSPTPSTILCMPRSPLAASGSLTARRLYLFVVLCFFPLAASAQTVDDIIERYVNARGGLAKIKSIQSERITGTMVFSPELQGPFVIERERPLKLHMEVTVGRDNLIRVYDGKSAGLGLQLVRHKSGCSTDVGK